MTVSFEDGAEVEKKRLRRKTRNLECSYYRRWDITKQQQMPNVIDVVCGYTYQALQEVVRHSDDEARRRPPTGFVQ